MSTGGLQDMRLCLPEEKLIGISTEGSQLGIWVADLQKREAGAVKPAGGNYSRPSATRTASGGGGAQGSGHISVGRAQVPRRSESSGDEPRVDHGERRSPKLGTRPEFDDPAAAGQPGAAARPRQKGGGSDEASRPGRGQQDSQAQRGSSSPKAFVGAPTPNLPAEAAGQEPPTREQAYPDRKRDDIRSRVHDQVLQQVGYSPKAHGANSPGMLFGDLNQGPSVPLVAEQADLPEAATAAREHRDVPAPRSTEEQGLRSPTANQRPQPSVLEAGADQVAQLALQHPQMMGVLQRRLIQVRRVNQLWADGNLGTLSEGLQFPQDHAVVCDFARAVMREKLVGALNLDACQTLLPVMRDLMCSKYDDFAQTGHQFAELLLQHFGDLISDTRRICAGIPERQLDIAREERLRKCNACHQQFCEIQKSLLEGRLASRFVSFRSALQTFLQRC